MAPGKSEAFAWENYLPQHRGLIALRFEQAKRLSKCSLCGKAPVAMRKALVHVSLKGVGAEALDHKPLVRALALCKVHAALDDDALADWAWPGWREQ